MAMVPSDPRGVKGFVRTHYAPRLRAAVTKKLLATGDTFTVAGTHGTPSSPRDLAHMPLPLDMIGVPGVHRYAERPNVNPADYITEQNSFGGYFTAPRTELTGLYPQQRADIKSFDAQTTGQQQRIQSAYENFAQQAASQGASTQQALTALAAARGAGYQAADPTAQVLGQAARDQAVASTAPIIAQIGTQPSIARDAGQTALNQFTAQRLSDRATTLANMRKLNSDVAQAAAEQQFKNNQLKATLAIAQGNQATTQRGQDLTAQTAGARIKADIAKLQTQLQIAQDNNQTKRVLALQKKITTKKKAASRASSSDFRAWTNMARKLWDGVPIGNSGQYAQYDPNEIIQQLMGAGATRAQAQRVVRGIVGGFAPSATLGRTASNVGGLITGIVGG